MRFFLSFAVLVTSLSSFSVVRGEDALFSEVAMESVFEKKLAATKNVASQSDLESIARITGISTLVRTLKAAGFEPQEKDGRATFQFEHAGWKFPVSLEVQVERDRIVCRFSLIEIGKDASLDHQVLLSLLAAGGATHQAFFAYDQAKEMIELRGSIGNRAVTATQLKADLNRLATLAESQSERWLKLKPQKKSSSGVSDPKKKTFSLVGRWSASTDKSQAFAIQIDSGGRFQLVHLKSGKSTVSKGKATRSGDRLTLAGDDGTKLNCTVTWRAAEGFQLAINDAKGNATVKLDFKKQG
jgi:hypothetical protein